MSKPPRVALIGGGKAAEAPLLRLRGVTEHLGPVKSSSFRVASRISNTLRAGHPAADYQEFEGCDVVMVGVPDASLAATLKALAAAPVSWNGKCAALLSGLLGCEQLEPLAQRGAITASVTPVAGFEDQWFLIEGSAEAQRILRDLIEEEGVRVTVIAPLLKPLYLAALMCSGPLVAQLILAAGHALRQAGVPAEQAAPLIDRQVARAMRAYSKGSKKMRQAWAIEDLVRGVREKDPRLGEYLAANAGAAARWAEGE